MAEIDAARALALVDAPFRPQGRDARRGLDCVGLCLMAYGFPDNWVRDDYRLRGHHQEEAKAAILTRFRRVSAKRARPGDLMMMQPASDQLHLAIMTERGFVHADARLRRVVEVPGRPRWRLLGIYRLRARRKH